MRTSGLVHGPDLDGQHRMTQMSPLLLQKYTKLPILLLRSWGYKRTIIFSSFGEFFCTDSVVNFNFYPLIFLRPFSKITLF